MTIEQQIHVERLVHGLLSDLDELLAIQNSDGAYLLTSDEAANLSAARAKLDLLAPHLRRAPGRAA